MSGNNERSLRCAKCHISWPLEHERFDLCPNCLQQGLVTQTKISTTDCRMSPAKATTEYNKGMFEAYYQSRLGQQDIDSVVNDLLSSVETA